MLHHTIGRAVANHFFPTKHNRFVPSLLRESRVWAMLFLGLAFFSFVQVARITGYFGLTAEVYPATVFALTNADRETNRLAPLSINETLAAAAKLKAQDMANKGYFAHTSPEGVTPWYWLAQTGYQFIYAGENLAVNFDDSGDVQKAWLDSPTHRANIMNENFTEMGVATATGEYNGVPATFVVEFFGMPATPKVVAAPVPSSASNSPAPVTAPAPRATTPVSTEVAGESAPHLSVLEETPEFVLAQNNDQGLEPGNPSSAPVPRVSWIKRLLLQSDRVAGLVIEAIAIAMIIATMGMVAREYEKHHRKHMAYGTLLAVIMFACLFVGRMGVFDAGEETVAAASTPSASLQEREGGV